MQCGNPIIRAEVGQLVELFHRLSEAVDFTAKQHNSKQLLTVEFQLSSSKKEIIGIKITGGCPNIQMATFKISSHGDTGVIPFRTAQEMLKEYRLNRGMLDQAPAYG